MGETTGSVDEDSCTCLNSTLICSVHNGCFVWFTLNKKITKWFSGMVWTPADSENYSYQKYPFEIQKHAVGGQIPLPKSNKA
jgi:hypothetical protein